MPARQKYDFPTAPWLARTALSSRLERAEWAHARTRPVADAMTATVTEPRQTVGTVNYLSREQNEPKGSDARSDIFSFGLVLYEILTGRRAFHASSQAGLMAASRKEDPQ